MIYYDTCYFMLQVNSGQNNRINFIILGNDYPHEIYIGPRVNDLSVIDTKDKRFSGMYEQKINDVYMILNVKSHCIPNI